MFKNYYTAFLSIRVRQHSSMHTPAKWVTCLRDYRLMPDPHREEGAQEHVSLFKHQVSWGSAGQGSPDGGSQGVWGLGPDISGKRGKAGLGRVSLASTLERLLLCPPPKPGEAAS